MNKAVASFVVLGLLAVLVHAGGEKAEKQRVKNETSPQPESTRSGFWTENGDGDYGTQSGDNDVNSGDNGGQPGNQGQFGSGFSNGYRDRWTQGGWYDRNRQWGYRYRGEGRYNRCMRGCLLEEGLRRERRCDRTCAYDEYQANQSGYRRPY